MKNSILYLFLILCSLAVGCSKVQITKKPSLNALTGTYSGQFLLIHVGSTKNDTSSAIIQLNLSANSTYSVTGDTSMLHAGSHGTFLLNSGTQIQFSDVTFPNPVMPTKIHLSGVYNYSFDNIYLDLDGADLAGTTFYSYTLTKQ